MLMDVVSPRFAVSSFVFIKWLFWAGFFVCVFFKVYFFYVMELKNFIETVLTDIFVGVANAQKNIADDGRLINPSVHITPAGVFHIDERGRKMPCVAEFDVALSISDNIDKGGKIGVKIAGFNVLGGAAATTETSNQTHVKFKVPYCLP